MGQRSIVENPGRGESEGHMRVISRIVVAALIVASIMAPDGASGAVGASSRRARGARAV